MNELAQRYNGKNQTQWFAVNWGLWATETGMQMQTDSSMQAMNSSDALRLLKTVYEYNLPVTAVYLGPDRLLKPARAIEKKSVNASLATENARQRLKEVIIECTKIRTLDDDVSLLEKGVDSIIATHIAIRIEKELTQSGADCKIPKTLIFQHATFNQIFAYLQEHHFNALHSVFPEPGTSAAERPVSPADQQLLPEQQTDKEEHFAIIAAAGEFPGALDLHEFWQLLKEGTHAIKPVPESRWDWQQQFSLDNSNKGKSYCRHGGFIDEAALFDNRYFKVTPRDAQKMTPEARRLLHQSYYALEQCHFLESLNGEVGVFVANMYAHYQNLNKEQELFDSSLSAMANHVSYSFKFNGPSMGIDAMCSGGLNALHVALNSLKVRDCNAVIVGAVNIMSHPGKYRFLSENKFLSPTGKCHSFGVAADGYVPGEGCVVLVIKRLEEAKAADDKILGVIRATAVNSNGAHSAMTVPSAVAQTQVIKKALLKSGLEPENISYIETHGTGTALGDPIEIEGLKGVYGLNQNPVAIGSLKSNIGHLEAAAGLASVVKVLLQMHYRMKVPSLHCEIENPLLGLEQSPFQLQKRLSSWGEAQDILYAGVSAFGAGGANAHLILESPPPDYAYSQLPRTHNKLAATAFWLDPQTPLPASDTDTVIKPLISFAADNRTVDKDKTIWLTKKLESCPEPLNTNQAEESITFFLVTEGQMEMMQSQASFILLHEAASALDLACKKYPQQKLVVVNLTAMVEQDEDAYLLNHFNFAKSLTNKAVNLDLILINPLAVRSPSAGFNAAVDGLYRTVSLENPRINTLIIQSDEPLIQIMSLTQNQRIMNVGTYQLNNGEWKKQQFVENIELPEQLHQPLLKEGGVYIISGGLGALGQIISKYLLSQYHAQVICLGRSSLTAVKWEQFQNLRAINDRIAYYQSDITDSLKVQVTIKEIVQRYGRIDGVINSACVLSDGLLSEKSFTAFNEVIKSKIQGTIHLDEATKTCDLDFFVSFSSMSAVYSNVGQADYCMANTFVDYFTEYREQLVDNGLRYGKSMSINWPLWAVDGLSLSAETIEYLCEATGMTPLNEAQGVLLFERLLDKQYPRQIIPLQGNKSDIRATLLGQKQVAQSPENSLNELVAAVAECLSIVTHLDLLNLNLQTSINELGMSSVLLTELAELLGKRFAISIAPSVFFSHNTIAKIGQYLHQKIPRERSDARIAKQQSAPATDYLGQKAENEFAIIGFSALLPGGPDPEQFWDSLIRNESAVRRMSRWEGEYFAATLDNIRHFDNQFFNLSNREAMLMDPQHRLFLQESYSALVDAGYPPATMKRVGVFAGVQFNDYQNLLSRHGIAQHAYMATGNSHSMLANRVSFLFDFNGPSQTVDTACSSALIAINRGILALKNNECELALCGAVSLLIDSGVTEAAKSMGVLSPNFRCATFDEQADGYVRGEGAGVFVLKRLDDAVRDKDAIHAIIVSSAENHGGKANSLTAPNPIAQKELLMKAYTPELATKVGYIETHGTGTRLGDPIEIDALTQAFNDLLPKANRKKILLGSVKTNVGHLEPAAGVASLIKVIYALKHKTIPANVHFNILNPYISLQDGPFKIADQNVSWDADDYVAGISSFGFGGSYAHLVLRHFPLANNVSARQGEFYFPLSARKPALLHVMKRQLRSFLSKENAVTAEALSYMLCCRREHFKHRFIVKCSSIAQLLLHLERDAMERLPEDDVMNDYASGKDIAWEDHFFDPPAKIHIPGYAFEKKEFWFDSSIESALELEHHE